jgi:hypothetical protein
LEKTPAAGLATPLITVAVVLFVFAAERTRRFSPAGFAANAHDPSRTSRLQHRLAKFSSLRGKSRRALIALGQARQRHVKIAVQ